MKVLIVDDDPSLTFYLQEVVRSTGHEALLARDGLSGFALFEEERPDLIIADLQMPGLTGMELLQKIRGAGSSVIFVLLTGYGSEETAIRAMELHASNYLAKPIRFEALTALLHKYACLLRPAARHSEVLRMIARREVSLKLPNSLELIPEVIDFLISETGDEISPPDRFIVRLGLYELLANAIEHGNLGIGFEEKKRALLEGPERLKELRRKRAGESARARRVVTIDYHMSEGRCEWVIHDEGEGFNWNAIPHPLDGENEEAVNGRGIFLARFQFDELTFLGAGNRVRAVKYHDTERDSGK